jgi:hypothetical protein
MNKIKFDVNFTSSPNNFLKKGVFDYHCPYCEHWDSWIHGLMIGAMMDLMVKVSHVEIVKQVLKFQR